MVQTICFENDLERILFALNDTTVSQATIIRRLDVHLMHDDTSRYYQPTRAIDLNGMAKLKNDLKTMDNFNETVSHLWQSNASGFSDGQRDCGSDSSVAKKY